MSDLAFVIPAYRGRFLKETVSSLAEQSDQRFSVYIGDDASPDNLEHIIEPFHSRLNLRYKRFNGNLGQRSLVKQWERCIALSTEAFFCLLADDDVLGRDCVAAFHAAMNEPHEKHDVYKFAGAVINERGDLIAYDSDSCRTESHLTFLYSRLRHQRISFMSSYVIRRDAYVRERGFVDFPLGWFSDDASIILYSRRTGIRWLGGQPAYWRMSNQSISSMNRSTYKKKIQAAVRYLKWITAGFGRDRLGDSSWDSDEIRAVIERWFFRHLDYSGCYPLRGTTLLRIAAAISPHCQSHTFALYKKLRSHIKRADQLRNPAKTV